MNVSEWKSRVAELGCIICGDAASLHHIREDQGGSQRASDFLVIPLCPLHHQHGTKMYAPSVHGAPQLFRSKYGRETDLLAETMRRVLATL